MNFVMDSSWIDKKVMFLDVATQSTGWAFHGPIDGKHILKHGAIQSNSPYLYERLRKLNRQARNVHELFHPDLIVIEAGFADNGDVVTCPDCNAKIKGSMSFWDRSAEITMMLAEARGAVATAFECSVMKISNTEWKKAIGLITRDKLKRDAVKYEAYLIACNLWGESLPITMLKGKATFDESDACAGLAYVLRDLRYEG